MNLIIRSLKKNLIKDFYSLIKLFNINLIKVKLSK